MRMERFTLVELERECWVCKGTPTLKKETKLSVKLEKCPLRICIALLIHSSSLACLDARQKPFACLVELSTSSLRHRPRSTAHLAE